jgi:hypothetical protein
MVEILIKRERINNKYFLTARSFEKSSRGKIIAKTSWNQKSKEEFRDRIKQKDVYREKIFNKKFEVSMLGEKTRVISYKGDRRFRPEILQYVAKIRYKGETYYGSSGFIKDSASKGAKEEAKDSARQNAVFQIYSLNYDTKADLSKRQIEILEDKTTITKVYYEN